MVSSPPKITIPDEFKCAIYQEIIERLQEDELTKPINAFENDAFI
jgi:hypothetical protein